MRIPVASQINGAREAAERIVERLRILAKNRAAGQVSEGYWHDERMRIAADWRGVARVVDLK